MADASEVPSDVSGEFYHQLTNAPIKDSYKVAQATISQFLTVLSNTTIEEGELVPEHLRALQEFLSGPVNGLVTDATMLFIQGLTDEQISVFSTYCCGKIPYPVPIKSIRVRTLKDCYKSIGATLQYLYQRLSHLSTRTLPNHLNDKADDEKREARNELVRNTFPLLQERAKVFAENVKAVKDQYLSFQKSRRPALPPPPAVAPAPAAPVPIPQQMYYPAYQQYPHYSQYPYQGDVAAYAQAYYGYSMPPAAEAHGTVPTPPGPHADSAE